MVHCKVCEAREEQHRCPACGKTGTEIARDRREN
jgi:hypothetical protein